MIVGLTLLARLADSHMAIAAIKTIAMIGVKLINISKGSFDLSSAKSKAAVMAPGPAISGVAIGNMLHYSKTTISDIKLYSAEHKLNIRV